MNPALDFGLFRGAAPGPAGGGALVVELPEGATAHRSPGRHFRRRGNRKRLMDAAEVRRLAQARGQSDVASTDMQVVRSTGVNRLKPELWRQYAISRADEPAEVALSKLKFVKDDRHGALRATVCSTPTGPIARRAPDAAGRADFVLYAKLAIARTSTRTTSPSTTARLSRCASR